MHDTTPFLAPVKPCGNDADAIAKLSRQQRTILVWLYRVYAELKAAGYARINTFGIPWRNPSANGFSRSEQASISRALKRLEQRELVLRQNEVSGCPTTGSCREWNTEPHARSTCVRLLPEGIRVAKRLTRESVDRMLTVLQTASLSESDGNRGPAAGKLEQT
jgi:hypothetical protein